MVISLQGDPLNSPVMGGQSPRLARGRGSSEGIDQPPPLRKPRRAVSVQVHFCGQAFSDSDKTSDRGSARLPLSLPPAVRLLS